MAEAVESAAASASGVAFELERIEADSDRLEVNGRWFGVRGRRFIRPSLTLLADEEQKRLLATLDHKPWAAEDGEPWKASFPYEQQDDQWLEAELNVAPDITVSVPLPGSRPARRRRSTASGGPSNASRAGSAGESRRTRSPSAELVKARREIHRVQRELERREAEIAELSNELSRRGAKIDEVSGARDAARKSQVSAAEERERLMRAHGEALKLRDEAAAQRDAADGERSEALRLRDAALAARDEALAERRAAIAERDELSAKLAGALASQEGALAERDDFVNERNALIDERDGALRDRDAAIAAGKNTVAERDELSATIERLRLERDDAVASRGAALVMRNAANAPPNYRPETNRILHFVPAVVVVAIALLAALLLHLI